MYLGVYFIGLFYLEFVELCRCISSDLASSFATIFFFNNLFAPFHSFCHSDYLYVALFDGVREVSEMLSSCFFPFFFLSLPQTGWSQLISLSSWIFSSPADICEVNFFLENFSFQLFYFKISIWFNFIIAIYIILTLMRYCFTLPFSSLDIVYVTEYI